MGSGDPRGHGGTVGGGLGDRATNGGSPLRRAPRWLPGSDEGTASCNRGLHTTPPPQRILFPASQVRELTRETATFQPPTPYTPPSPVQALGLGASTEYTWRWHVTLGTPGNQGCCEDCVGSLCSQSQPGLRKELIPFLLVVK